MAEDRKRQDRRQTGDRRQRNRAGNVDLPQKQHWAPELERRQGIERRSGANRGRSTSGRRPAVPPKNHTNLTLAIAIGALAVVLAVFLLLPSSSRRSSSRHHADASRTGDTAATDFRNATEGMKPGRTRLEACLDFADRLTDGGPELAGLLQTCIEEDLPVAARATAEMELRLVPRAVANLRRGFALLKQTGAGEADLARTCGSVLDAGGDDAAVDLVLEFSHEVPADRAARMLASRVEQHGPSFADRLLRRLAELGPESVAGLADAYAKATWTAGRIGRLLIEQSDQNESALASVLDKIDTWTQAGLGLDNADLRDTLVRLAARPGVRSRGEAVAERLADALQRTGGDDVRSVFHGCAALRAAIRNTDDAEERQGLDWVLQVLDRRSAAAFRKEIADAQERGPEHWDEVLEIVKAAFLSSTPDVADRAGFLVWQAEETAQVLAIVETARMDADLGLPGADAGESLYQQYVEVAGLLPEGRALYPWGRQAALKLREIAADLVRHYREDKAAASRLLDLGDYDGARAVMAYAAGCGIAEIEADAARVLDAVDTAERASTPEPAVVLQAPEEPQPGERGPSGRPGRAQEPAPQPARPRGGNRDSNRGSAAERIRTAVVTLDVMDMPLPDFCTAVGTEAGVTLTYQAPADGRWVEPVTCACKDRPAVDVLGEILFRRNLAVRPEGSELVVFEPDPRETQFEGRHYTVIADLQPDLVRELGRRMDRIYDTYSRIFRFGRNSRERMVLRVFRRQRDYNVYTEGTPLQTTSVGMYIPAKGELAASHEREWDQFLGTLQHEGCHQFVDQRIDTAMNPLPTWLNEGLACYFQQAHFDGNRFVIGPYAEKWFYPLMDEIYPSGNVVPFRNVVNAGPEAFYDGPGGWVYYSEAWAIVNYLIQGEDGRHQPLFNSLLVRWSKGQPADFDRVIGEYTTLEARVKAHMEQLARDARRD